MFGLIPQKEQINVFSPKTHFFKTSKLYKNMKDSKKMIQCSRILTKLNNFLEEEFEMNGKSKNFEIWSKRYDKIASYYQKLVGL